MTICDRCESRDRSAKTVTLLLQDIDRQKEPNAQMWGDLCANCRDKLNNVMDEFFRPLPRAANKTGA